MSTNKILIELTKEDRQQLFRELLKEFPEDIIQCPTCDSTSCTRHGYYAHEVVRYICENKHTFRHVCHCSDINDRQIREYKGLRLVDEYNSYKKQVLTRGVGTISGDSKEFHVNRTTIRDWRLRMGLV